MMEWWKVCSTRTVSDACEVAMCLAIPVRVTECLPDSKAKVRVGEGETYMEVSTLLLPENVHVGDYLIVHAGFALRVLEPREAEESLKLFRQIAEQDGLSVNF
jgi:hydrogenase expression/formation protein HypC